MKILSIETSCDETGICILEHRDNRGDVTLLGNALASQIDIHAKYGGVFPALAKRAHTEKMVPLLKEALNQARLLVEGESTIGGNDTKEKISSLCTKDVALADHLEKFLNEYKKPNIDYIAVTVGPGLEPALWVGVNTAKVLGSIWNIPIIPINHMEGHIVTAAFEEIPPTASSQKKYKLINLAFPVLSLLVSGGHTELVIAHAFGKYTKIGQTRDDAVGEAFDKVARMMNLTYPGGPAISKLASDFRKQNIRNTYSLPRPMLHSGDYDFSFSGIKTAVLYLIHDLEKENSNILQNTRMISEIAEEFENAVVEVLVKKTISAGKEFHTPTIIVGGGVAGNTHLRTELTKAVEKELPGTTLLFPEPWLATDNAVMIGMAAITQIKSGQIKTSVSELLIADGNLSIAS